MSTADVPQHMKALERANEVRMGMAERKREIGRGEIDPSKLFDVDLVGDLTVAEVLTSQRRWGATRARHFLTRAEPNRGRRLEGVKIRDLTKRERDALTEALVERLSKNGNKPNQGD